MTRDYPINKTRNIGLVAHIDAGKTTVTERILFYTGISHKIGEVHEGEAIMDWMSQEQERGITITSAATTCFWELSQKEDADTYRINIIDTPGHIDFTVEVQRSLRVLDGAVIVFDGVAGVESQSETVWRQADRYGVPRICFINKMDKMGASIEKTLQSIHDRLTSDAVLLQIPIGEGEDFEGAIDLLEMEALYFEGERGHKVKKEEIPEELKGKAKQKREDLIETVAGEDDKLLEKYVEGKEISNDEIRRVLREATLDNRLIPVFCGSALQNKGIQPLLDAVINYLPNPGELPPVEGVHPKTEEEEKREAKDDAPFAALAFKVATDPYVGTLTYFRVYSGSLEKGSYVLNTRTGEKERIGRLLRMHSNNREEVDGIFAGGIAATVGLSDTKTGDTLCAQDHPIVLEDITFPEPVISVRVEPETKADEEKLSNALNKLGDEDPTFKVRRDSDTGETIISGMGELHLEVITDRLKREFDVKVDIGQPQVAYKESITHEAEAQGEYVKQSGGRGQYGDVWLRVEPKERGEGFEFVDKITGGVIPKEFIPAVEKGVKEALDKGIVAGYKMVDVKATVFDGSHHDVDSSEVAFKIAASMALQNAAKRAESFILEPIMKVEVVIPDKFFGDVISDLSSRRGKVEETEDRDDLKVIHSKVPLSEMFGYATTLRSLTKGRGTFTMEFETYKRAPKNIAEEIKEGKK